MWLSMRTWLSVSSVALLLVAAGCGDGRDPTWTDPSRPARIPVMVRANGFERADYPVQVTGDWGSSVRVVEVGEEDRVLDGAVPYQIDYGTTLIFLLKGRTAADRTRHYYVYRGEPEVQQQRGQAKPVEPEQPRALVTATDGIMHQGQESIMVTSPAGAIHYHKKGGGLASLIDSDNHDWIGYRPGGGSAGAFRGIPNIIYPEGGLHPGAEGCESRLLSNGPLMARIHTSCHGGAWEVEWRFFPSFARLEVEKVAHPYWVLYEGVPGGSLEPGADYWVRSDGTKQLMNQEWEGRLPAPRWVYFGDPTVPRVLFFAHSEDDGTADQFHSMEGNMAVFGFGRKLKCCAMSLTRTPAHFTLGLIAATGHDRITTVINGILKELIVSQSGEQKRPY